MEASYETGHKTTPRKLAWIGILMMLLAVLIYGVYKKPGILETYFQPEIQPETAVSQSHFSLKEAPPEMPLAERDLEDVVASKSEDTMNESHEEVFFGFNSFRIQPRAADALKMVAAAIQRFPEAQILIDGHSDNVGDPQANLVMSERRAEAVKRWLIDHTGVEASRFIVKGWGPARPKFSNNSPEGRRKNRRVDITLRGHNRTDNTVSIEAVPGDPRDSRHANNVNNF